MAGMNWVKVAAAVRLMIPFLAVVTLGWMLGGPPPYRYVAVGAWICWGFVYTYDNPPWKR
jgi:fatty acid desaturase